MARRAGRTGRNAGMALVLVLAMLVLMLVAVLAFFSTTLLDRQINSSSTATQQVELLGRTATDMIVADLRQEIEAGSESDIFLNPTTMVRQPLTIATTNQMLGTNVFLSTAPSMVPQRVVAGSTNAPATLIKQSLRDQKFFSFLDGYSNRPTIGTVLARAASDSTTNTPQRGHAISATSWKLPQLATNQTLSAPDWIYVNRAGETPSTLAPDWSNQSATNRQYIVGRYAYNLYDVGGLIDINTVGNKLSATENARRGRLHQISLTNAPAPLAITNFVDFVAWRSGSDAANGTTNMGGLFDPKRTFLNAPPSGQALVSRQDLIRYAKTSTAAISTNALPFLTTFNRFVNAPSEAPEPNRPRMTEDPVPADKTLVATQLNPPTTSARFATEVTLTRGTDPDVKAPAGSPVMFRRFPLSKISLLSEQNPDSATVLYYFGLAKNADGSWRYAAAASDGRIKRLSEVAAENREPNFFEVLQATILTGSLGRNAGNTYSLNQPRDKLQNLQVIQIGANIIDQWDGNDFPTTIQFGVASDPLTVYGIENLPYFNNIAMVGFCPSYDRNRFQVWAIFDVWNPHQNATSPLDIDSFRIVPRAGKVKATIRYDFNYTFSGSTISFGEQSLLPFQDVVGNNADRSLTFANSDYSQPKEIGGDEPTAANYNGGLLLVDYPNLPPAVDDPPTSKASLIEEIVKNSKGTRFGKKGYNYFRLFSSVVPSEKIVFELQYRSKSDSTWRTYQRLDGIFPLSQETGEFKGMAAGSETVTHGKEADTTGSAKDDNGVGRDTHHSKGILKDYGFYTWRDQYSVNTCSVNMARFDPRTVRFGLSGHLYETLGSTIRESINTPVWPTSSLYNTDIYKNARALRSTSKIISGFNPSGTTFDPNPEQAFFWAPPLFSNTYHRIPFGYIANVPEAALNNQSNPSRYADRDGVIRPGDGYLGSIPTAKPISSSGKGSIGDRPLILNRPFRSVGEMGYVFRDLPWKTLDFFTKNSGDLGLLDVFSLDETEGDLPLVAGKLNLNSAPKEVITALLLGTGKDNAATTTLTATEAADLAQAIVTERAKGPFRDRGDLVARVLSPTSNLVNSSPYERKTEREAAIRTLAEIGETRTWNFLLDLVAQTGRFIPGAKDFNQFTVRAERRYWVHLAIDRLTGEVVDQQWEPVDEE